MATDAQALVYKVPGGMLSNMIANLTDLHAMDKFDAALVEIPKVRRPIWAILPLVTPHEPDGGHPGRHERASPGERYKVGVQGGARPTSGASTAIAPAPVSEELARPRSSARASKPVDCRVG